jgi:hypothetical protein
LSEEQWQRVLVVELKGRRTKASVRGRFVQLNDELLKEFLLDGYVPLHRVHEYMSRAIGERPRRPPVREQRARKRRDPTRSPTKARPKAVESPVNLDTTLLPWPR